MICYFPPVTRSLAQPPRKGHFKTRHELLQIKGLGPKSALKDGFCRLVCWLWVEFWVQVGGARGRFFRYNSASGKTSPEAICSIRWSDQLMVDVLRS